MSAHHTNSLFIDLYPYSLFVCNVQNILGVILFLRLPFIVAQAGVFEATGVVFICVTSTFLTSLSLSAIATNGKVLLGGPYFLISRNLGRGVGGAVGFLFYIGTTLASSMYTLGAVEAFQTGFYLTKSFKWDTQIEALCLITVLASIVAVGVKYVNMSALVFLFIVIMSFVSFVIGGIAFSAGTFNGQLPDSARVSGDNYHSNYQPDPTTGITPTFFSLLALFYPSVTGIMAGSNRSAVLRSPGTSIPVGTLSAVGLTTLMYIIVVWLFGCSISNNTLMNNKMVVAKLAFPAEIIVNLGIIMSCVGAGLQSLTGAPQLLAAMAADETIPFLIPFKATKNADGTTSNNRAVCLTWAIGALPCLAGNLDFITAPLTMMFLMMYATTNFSTFIVAFVKSPSFRPRWRYFNKWVSLLGFFWCLGIMFLISWQFAFLVILLAASLVVYIQTKGTKRDYGDSITGIELSVVRRLLLWLNREDDHIHTKNWRPQILALIKTDQDGILARPQVLRLADQLKKGKGLLMVHSVLEGNILTSRGECVTAHANLVRQMKEMKCTGFVKATMSESRPQGIVSAIQSEGVGHFRPNTVMFGWDKKWRTHKENVQTYVNCMKTAVAMTKALMILKGGENLPVCNDKIPPGEEIHMWWVCPDGGFVLIIPYLLCLHRTWHGVKLKLFVVMNDTDNLTKEEVEARMAHHMDQIRIDADVVAVDLHDAEIVSEFTDIFIDSAEEELNDDDTMFDLVGDGQTHTRLGSGPNSASVSKNSSTLDLAEKDKRESSVTVPPAAEVTVSAATGTSEVELSILTQVEDLSSAGNINMSLSASQAFLTDGALSISTVENSPVALGDTSPFGSSPRRTRRPSLNSNTKEKRSLSVMSDEVIFRANEVGCEPIRIRAAMALNAKMKELSLNAKLIVSNLPLTLKTVPLNFMGYIDMLTEDLPSILLVRPASEQATVTANG